MRKLFAVFLSLAVLAVAFAGSAGVAAASTWEIALPPPPAYAACGVYYATVPVVTAGNHVMYASLRVGHGGTAYLCYLPDSPLSAASDPGAVEVFTSRAERRGAFYALPVSGLRYAPCRVLAVRLPGLAVDGFDTAERPRCLCNPCPGGGMPALSFYADGGDPLLVVLLPPLHVPNLVPCLLSVRAAADLAGFASRLAESGTTVAPGPDLLGVYFLD
ncbi:hypothetical protein [Desulfothermobacter acidiphilus]|uniref:hypothetical protein n=1 Tax=Desulfothermobacter acidiphilus TaxID=1938353 RepID=UPI003F8A6B57